MKKIIFIFIVGLFFICNCYAAQNEIVIDADSGRVLYGKNINQKELIASTTKIMTALVVLNNTDINNEVTIGKEVNDAYGSAIYIKEKEKLLVKDLLYGLLLRSGNDAALSLAVYTAGSVDGFVKLMNETAMYIGMKNTVFTNPHGLDEESENISTVYDMAILMREAMKNKDFRKITSTRKYELKTNFNTYSWYNKNKLLETYEFATGGKIGYTKRAKHTFVSSATKDNKNLIIATFKDDDQFNNHKTLYEKYFKIYKKYRLIDKNKLKIKYDKNYKVYTLSNFDMLLTRNEKKKIKRTITFYKNVKCNDSCNLGKIEISLDNKIYKTLNIYAEKIKDNKKKKIFNYFS